MGLFGKIIDFIVPPLCGICSLPCGHGRDLCDTCRERFVRECFAHCPVCGKTAAGCVCGTEFTDVTKRSIGNRQFFSLTFYFSERSQDKTDRVTEKMIFAFKERGIFSRTFAEDLSRGLTQIYSDAGEDIRDWIITYPPRSLGNFYKYGMDQCEVLSGQMAKKLGCRTAKTFLRVGKSVEQKTLSAGGRRENAEESLIPIRRNIVNGGKYILLDDIITSGATVTAAADILYSCGAAAVFPVSVARTAQPGK